MVASVNNSQNKRRLFALILTKINCKCVLK